MRKFNYNGRLITAGTKKQAVRKILSGSPREVRADALDRAIERIVDVALDGFRSYVVKSPVTGRVAEVFATNWQNTAGFMISFRVPDSIKKGTGEWSRAKLEVAGELQQEYKVLKVDFVKGLSFNDGHALDWAEPYVMVEGFKVYSYEIDSLSDSELKEKVGKLLTEVRVILDGMAPADELVKEASSPSPRTANRAEPNPEPSEDELYSLAVSGSGMETFQQDVQELARKRSAAAVDSAVAKLPAKYSRPSDGLIRKVRARLYEALLDTCL